MTKNVKHFLVSEIELDRILSEIDSLDVAGDLASNMLIPAASGKDEALANL